MSKTITLTESQVAIYAASGARWGVPDATNRGPR